MRSEVSQVEVAAQHCVFPPIHCVLPPDSTRICCNGVFCRCEKSRFPDVNVPVASKAGPPIVSPGEMVGVADEGGTGLLNVSRRRTLVQSMSAGESQIDVVKESCGAGNGSNRRFRMDGFEDAACGRDAA